MSVAATPTGYRSTFWVALALAAAGCEQHDLGTPCDLEVEDSGSATGDTRAETPEVVEQSIRFPCQDLICVASDGRNGYCSKKCREDAGCPAGFECRIIQRVGPFATQKFCAWKRCARPKECGSKDDFRCVKMPSAVAGEEYKLCDFRD